MPFFLKFIIFALGLLLGLLILKFLDKIVYTIGKNEWAERKIGSGGSYVVWQWLAMTIIVGTFLIALFS